MATEELLADRYRPLRLIGTGGMARVFLATDERLGRQVAVKRLHAHSPEDTARRFQREARIGAALNHPNLVSVYDVDTDGESVLIVMEYVEGTTLAEELRQGPLVPERAASILEQVGDALDHVHARGVVHRDVKPANILLRPDGTAKLTDLGIALASESTQITVSGTVLGTASYMAPEQIDGGEVGPAADVYSLAAVAFEMLSGRKAQEGDTPMAVAHRVVNEPPPDLRDAWPDADPAVAAVLTRAMAHDPADRHHRAGEMTAELVAALRKASSKPDAPVLATHRTRRPWLPIAAALIAVCLIAAGALALVSGSDDGDKSASPAPSTEAKATKPRTETVTAPQQATPPASTPEQQAEAPAGTGTATSPSTSTGSAPAGSGARLNQQGYALMNRGDYTGAIPILQKAVASYGSGSKDLNYAFALFNLGRSLRLAGRPDDAIPVLERRLAIPNQTKTVQKELDAARKAAGKKSG